MVALVTTLNGLRGEAYELGFSFDDLMGKAMPMAGKMKDTAEAVERLRFALKALSGDTSAASGALKDQDETIAKANKALDDRVKLYGAESAALRGNTGALDAYNREKARAEEYDKSYADALKSGVGETAAHAKAAWPRRPSRCSTPSSRRARPRKAASKTDRQAERDAEAYKRTAEEIDRATAAQKRLTSAEYMGKDALASANTETRVAEALAKARVSAETDAGRAIAAKTREEEKWRASAVQAKTDHALLTDALKDGRTEAEEYAKKVGDLQAAFQRAVAAGWKPTKQELADFNRAIKEADPAFKAAQEAGKEFTSTLASSISGLVKGTSTWADALDKVLDELVDIALQAAFKPLESSSGSLFGGIFGSLFGSTSAAASSTATSWEPVASTTPAGRSTLPASRPARCRWRCGTAPRVSTPAGAFVRMKFLLLPNARN